MNQTLEDMKKLAEKLIANPKFYNGHTRNQSATILRLIEALEFLQKMLDIYAAGNRSADEKYFEDKELEQILRSEGK